MSETLKIGETYTSRDGRTAYVLDAVNNDKITATVIRGDLMPRKSVGKQRVEFCTVREFQTWLAA